MLNARIRKAKTELYSLPLADAPSLLEIANNLFEWKKLNSRWQRIENLKSYAKAIIFFEEYGIRDITDIIDKAESMYDESRDLYDEIKKIDRRQERLALNLAHVDTRKKHKSIVAKYHKLTGRKQADFYNKHKNEIDEYSESTNYLVKILKNKKTIPVKEWEKEWKDLYKKRYTLCDRYYELRDDIQNVEKLGRSAKELIDDVDFDRQQRGLSLDLEL